MTLKQASKQLAVLGFKIGNDNGPVHGTIEAEAFNSYPNKILSTPTRDVFIGQTSKGWYVTSHINFQSQHIRHKQTHFATILNIIGIGATLNEAMEEFVANFQKKIYNGPVTNTNEAVPTGLKRVVGTLGNSRWA